MLETLVAEGGPGDWEKKAQALGTGRTAKALEVKWSRRSQAAKPVPAASLAAVRPRCSSAGIPKPRLDTGLENEKPPPSGRPQAPFRAASELPPSVAAAAGRPKPQLALTDPTGAAKPKEWFAEELEMLETLVAEDGSGDWEEKARALGTGRTAKSVENKWYRHSLSGSPGMRAKPSPKPEMPPGTGQWGIGQARGANWSKDEVAKLTELVRRDGPGRWGEKAAEMGTGRTGAALSNHFCRIHSEYFRKERLDSDGLASRDRSGLGTYRRTTWSPKEDDLLRKAVKTFRPTAQGRQDILFSAAMVPGRSAKQCRERWRNHVDPSISREPWSEEENALLLRLYEEHYGRWCEISVAFAGRPDEA